MLSVPDGAKVCRSRDRLLPRESTLCPTWGPVLWTGTALLTQTPTVCLISQDALRCCRTQDRTGLGRRPPGPGAECTCFLLGGINVGPTSTGQPGLCLHQSPKALLWTKGSFLL